MKKTLQRARKALDHRIAFMRPVDRLAVPPKGWVRAIRDAIGMSGPQLARRMGVTPQSVLNLEQSEAAATIRLETLSRAAEALNCTLVYALVPNEPLEDQIRHRANEIALRELGGVSHSMALEDQSVHDDDLAARMQDFVNHSLQERDLWDDR